MKYKAVFFDLDGTLMDTSEGIFACGRYAMDKAGIEYWIVYAEDEAGAKLAGQYGVTSAPTLFVPAEDGYALYGGLSDILTFVKESSKVTA